MRKILKALFDGRAKIGIQRQRLPIERILGRATGGIQLIQGRVQLHQLIVIELRVESCIQLELKIGPVHWTIS